MIQDIEMPALTMIPDVNRRLLVTKHKRTVDMENRVVTLDVAVFHYKTINGEEVPFTYIGKGNGLRRFRLTASDRVLVDTRTGLNATADGENDPYLMPEFSFLLAAIQQGMTEAELVQNICQRNVDRDNFDGTTYEILE